MAYRRRKPIKPKLIAEGQSPWGATRYPEKSHGKPDVLSRKGLANTARQVLAENYGYISALDIPEGTEAKLRNERGPHELRWRHVGDKSFDLQGRLAQEKGTEREVKRFGQAIKGTPVDPEMEKGASSTPGHPALRRAIGDPDESGRDKLVYSTGFDGEGDVPAKVDGLNEPETGAERDAREQEAKVRYFGQSRFGRG